MLLPPVISRTTLRFADQRPGFNKGFFMFNRFKQFVQDIQAEFKRVHWPTREATLRSTSIVLLLSLIIAVFLGITDIGLASMMKFIISTG